MSFSYFEALPADVKAQLSFSEVEDLIRVFQHFDKAREGVLDKGTAPNDFAREVANKLGERFGNANGFLDALPVNRVNEYEAAMLSFLRTDHADLLATIRETKDLGDDAKAGLKAALDAFAKTFA